jgi:sugar phosphate isomerase/epimerase
MKATIYALLIAVIVALAAAPARAAEPATEGGVFAKSNLVAWCIVPFDAAKRGPQERAQMLQGLGIRRFAYDWRSEHVPTFEEEILQLKKHGIEYFAYYANHPNLIPLYVKHGLTPQYWIVVGDPGGKNDEEKIAAAITQLRPMVERTRALGWKMGLYNHGSWGGEPANMVAVVKRLREEGNNDHVGIVYNFHHAHEHIGDFAEVFALMQPYLLCLNLNGMNDGAKPKILPVGSGQHEQAMMEIVKRSGYTGPIGILGHRVEVDAEIALKENLDGMKKVLKQMGDEAWKTYD